MYSLSGIGISNVCGVGFLPDSFCIFGGFGVVKKVSCCCHSLLVGFLFSDSWCLFGGKYVSIVLRVGFLSDSRYLISGIGVLKEDGLCSNPWYLFGGIGVSDIRYLFGRIGRPSMLVFVCWSDSWLFVGIGV